MEIINLCVRRTIKKNTASVFSIYLFIYTDNKNHLVKIYEFLDDDVYYIAASKYIQQVVIYT